LGILVALVLAYLNKRALGGFVSELLGRGATNPRAAVRFSELDSSRNPLVFWTLKLRGTFRRMIYIVTGAMDAGYNERQLKIAFPEPAGSEVAEALSETAELAAGGTLNLVTSSAGQAAAAASQGKSETQAGPEIDPAERERQAKRFTERQRRAELSRSDSVYIPEHFEKKARILYADKTASVFTLALAAVLLLLVLIVIYYAVPAILNFWNNFVMGGGSGY